MKTKTAKRPKRESKPRRTTKPAAINPLRTLDDLRTWLCEHWGPIHASDIKQANVSPELVDQELLWFHAMCEAEGFSDLRMKDIAHLLIDGVPKLTLADLNTRLDDLWQDHTDETADLKALKVNAEAYRKEVEGMLREHFGLDRNRSHAEYADPSAMD